MCQKELEADLCTSKSDFLRAVADLNSIKEEKIRDNLRRVAGQDCCLQRKQNIEL